MEIKLNLFLLASAQRSLEEIALIHCELSGPEAARRITDQIYAVLEKLKTHWHKGLACQNKQLTQEGYRMLLTDNYLCIFRKTDDTIFVRNCFRI